MATTFEVTMTVTMPGDDPEDELEDLQESIGAMMMGKPSWNAHVDIVHKPQEPLSNA